jgi:NADPH-dependent glutamate synthase beta subunit-like oxidoreductase
LIIQKLIAEKFSRTGKKIAIIGAGPAGLTAAFYLVRLGHEVMVYEAQAEAGGVLRYGIPEYRLPREVLAKEIEFIKTLGVKFIFNKMIGAAQLKKIQHEADAVFLATGAYKDMPLGISGEKCRGVISGVDYLKDVAMGQKPKIGKDVLIVGAGNVAIDAARSAWRLGSKATVVYRREKKDMPANKEEILEAEHEGIKFMFFAAPKEVLIDSDGKVKALKITKMTPGDYDSSGRRKPVVTAETHDIPCDAVIVAIGEKVDSEFLEEAGIEINKNATAKADSVSLATNIQGIYAGGDLTAGPATAVEAMADGKKAAKAIDRELTGKDRFAQLFTTTIIYDDHVAAEVFDKGKQSGKKLSVPQRKNNFREVSLGLTKPQVAVESLRCLRCDVKA